MDKLFRGLVLLLLVLPGPAALHADDQAQDQPILIGIGEVPEEAKNCALLENKTADECDPEFQQTSRALRRMNEAIDSGLGHSARDGIDALVPYNLSRSWLFQTGVHVGVHELTIDEVRADPIRRAIDDERRARNATAGSWVKHTLEIRPRLGIGYRPSESGPIAINSLLLGFLPQFSIQVQVIKHYDLPVDFPTGTEDRARELKKKLGQTMKNFIQLPSQVGGGNLDKGESVQLESYLSATGVPSVASEFSTFAVGTFLFGGFSRVGFEYFQTVRYRRYTIQKEGNGKLHMILETPDLKRWGPFADVGLSANLGIIDVSISAANMGYRWLSEKNLVQEYEVDLSSEDAKHALRKAYLWGDFKEVERLALEDCSNSSGVEKTSETKANGKDLGTHAHGWRVKAFFWAAGNTYSTTDQVETPVACHSTEPAVESHVDELQKIRKGFRATRIFDVGIRTTKTKSDGGHSLWVKFNYTGKTTKKDEILEFLKVARLITEPRDEANASKIKAELDKVNALDDGDRIGRVHAYISLEFDSTAIATILKMDEKEREAIFRKSWTDLIGPPSDSDNPRGTYKQHLKRLEKFLIAAKRGIAAPSDLEQAKLFVNGLERAGIDLYPFAAMLASLPETHHVMSTAQIYLAGENRSEDRLIDPSHVGPLFNDDTAPPFLGTSGAKL